MRKSGARIFGLLGNYYQSSQVAGSTTNVFKKDFREFVTLFKRGNFIKEHRSPYFVLGSRQFADYPAFTELTMPSLSPTMEQGNIANWEKSVGDSVEPGDILANIETDKATMPWEAQEEGYLSNILVEAGAQNIKVGTPLALLVENQEDVPKMANYTTGAAPSTPGPSEAKSEPEPAAPSKPSGAAFPPYTPMLMPALSPTMTQGNILEWNKQEGDEIAAGDVLCEIETDKATLTWDSQDEGYVAKILKPAGSTDIAIGTAVFLVVEDKDSVPAFANFTEADLEGAPSAKPVEAVPATPEAAPTPPPTPTPTPTPAPSPTPALGERVVASPYAKKLAREQGVQLQGAAGSGPGGRILAADISRIAQEGPAAGIPSPVTGIPTGEPVPEFIDIPVTQIKKVTAKRLLESKQTIPHYYLTMECEVDEVMRVRAQINKALQDNGVKLSLNDMIIKASALALRQVPEANSHWYENYIRQYNSADICVAVQTPIGLLTPIVKNSDLKGLQAISAEVKQLAAKAKDGKLQPHEFMGGTFTISNLGMYGIKEFCAVINPPQSCILAVGAAFKKTVKDEETNNFKQVTVMNATLSCDHRVVDGAKGAEWLLTFKKYLENPLTMML